MEEMGRVEKGAMGEGAEMGAMAQRGNGEACVKGER